MATRDPGRILVVDDTELNIKLLADILEATGHSVVSARSGREALEKVTSERPDLVLLDVVMPGMDGYEVCRHLRANPANAMLPVILITASEPLEQRAHGLESGADDFISKPFHRPELLARVHSLLRIKRLYDTVERQRGELTEWNRTLEARVAEQVSQIERMSRLKRFFSPQLADLIVHGGADDPLKSHRREITVAFIDLRGFTAFAESAEPEDVMRVLGEYQAAMGRIVTDAEGTLERFTGDGMMIFFNDPLPIPDPPMRAVRMALDMRDTAKRLSESWRKLGYQLDFGVGIAQGYATVGAIGFEERWDYAAIGPVTNVASRLCAEAQPGSILVTQRVAAGVESHVELAPLPPLSLRGMARPVTVYSVIGPRPRTAST